MSVQNFQTILETVNQNQIASAYILNLKTVKLPLHITTKHIAVAHN